MVPVVAKALVSVRVLAQQVEFAATAQRVVSLGRRKQTHIVETASIQLLVYVS